jgi:hypothetical protein
MFHPLSSLLVTRNLWLILFSKIGLLLNFVKHATKNSKLIFSLALGVVEFLAILCLFHQIKVAKHIWDQCCHLAAETGS